MGHHDCRIEPGEHLAQPEGDAGFKPLGRAITPGMVKSEVDCHLWPPGEEVEQTVLDHSRLVEPVGQHPCAELTTSASRRGNHVEHQRTPALPDLRRHLCAPPPRPRWQPVHRSSEGRSATAFLDIRYHAADRGRGATARPAAPSPIPGGEHAYAGCRLRVPLAATSGFRLPLLIMLRALGNGGPTHLLSISPYGRAELDEADPTFGLENVCRVPVRPGGARHGGLAQPRHRAAIGLGDRRRVWGPHRPSLLRRWVDLPGRAFSQHEGRRWPGSTTRRGRQADEPCRGRTGCTRCLAVTRP